MSVYPKAPTARIVKSAGAERISADAVATLSEAVDNYCASVGAKAIDLATQNKTDIFGFGKMFYQEYPKYFKKQEKEWNDNLDKIEININSDLMLKNKVSSKTSLEEIHD